MFKSKEIKMVSIIWVFMMLSIVLYGVLAISLIKNPDMIPRRGTGNENYQIFVIILSALSSFIGLISVVLKKVLLKKMNKNVSPRSLDRKARFRYMIISIVSFVLCEIIAVYGLFLFVLTRNQNIFWIFAGASLILFVVNKPSVKEYEVFKESMKEVHG